MVTPSLLNGFANSGLFLVVSNLHTSQGRKFRIKKTPTEYIYLFKHKAIFHMKQDGIDEADKTTILLC